MTPDVPSNPLAWFLVAIAAYFVFLFKLEGPRSLPAREGLQRWLRFSGSALAIFLAFALAQAFRAERGGPDFSEMVAIGAGLLVAALVHLVLDRREHSQISAVAAKERRANAAAVPPREPGFSGDELERLRQGDIDARLKLRVEAEIEALGKRIEERNARAEVLLQARARGLFAYSRNLENRRPISKPFAWMLIGLMLAILGGAFLEIGLVGRGFLFAYSEQYRLIAVLLFLPITWLFVRAMKKLGAQWWLVEQFPRRWMRRYIAYPGFLVMGLSLIIFAPLGWIGLAGWATGTPFEALPGTMITANGKSEHDCSYRDKLEVDGNSGPICMRNRFTGARPRAGDEVVVSGRRSALGIYVENIQVR